MVLVANLRGPKSAPPPVPSPTFSNIHVHAYNKPPHCSVRERWWPSATYFCPLPIQIKFLDLPLDLYKQLFF